MSSLPSSQGGLCHHIRTDAEGSSRLTLDCTTCGARVGSPCYLPDGWKSLALELMLVIRGSASAGPRDEVLAMYDRAEHLPYSPP